MTTLRETFTKIGYSEEQLPIITRLVDLTGGLDGQIKESVCSDAKVSELLDQEITLEELNERFQPNYFKRFRQGGERQQIADNPELANIRDQVMEMFDQLGFMSTVAPQSEAVDMAFVFGATQVGMQGRVDSLLKLEDGQFIEGNNNPLSTGQIFILSGARDLWLDSSSDPVTADLIARRLQEKDSSKTIEEHKQQAIEEGKQILESFEGNLGQKRQAVVNHFQEQYGIAWPTEADAARHIIENNDRLRGRARVADAPKRENGTRPDTFDTVVALRDQYPEVLEGNKAAIAVSSQPFIRAQAVPLKLLPENINIQTVGNAVDPDKGARPELLLPELAGGIFKELQLERFLAKQQGSQTQDQSRPAPSMQANSEESKISVQANLDSKKGRCAIL
jgi:hypothetical protein